MQNARVPSQTLAHGNSDNDKDKEAVREGKKIIVNMEKRKDHMKENTET